MKSVKIEGIRGGFDRNVSYIVYNPETKKAIVIDPFYRISIYYKKAKELGVAIVGVLNTHSHKDHVEGNSAFRKQGVEILEQKSQEVGGIKINAIKTPGHTDDSTCYHIENAVFTGDTLFANRVGFTKSDENTKELYESLKKLMKLPEKTLVYPGHEYSVKIPVTIKREKENNPYLNKKSFEEFKELLDKWRAKKFGWRFLRRRIKWIKYRYLEFLFRN